MDRTNRHLCPAWWLLATAATLLVGCAGTKVTQLERDPGFTFSRMGTNGIAVAYVAVRARDDKEEGAVTPHEMTSLLHRSITNETDGFTLLGPGDVGFTDDAVGHLVARYEKTGVLRGSEVAELDSLLEGGAQYLVFARIDENATGQKEVTNVSTDEETEKKTTKTTLSARRSLAISFDVYDLRAGTVSMTTVISGSLTNERMFEETESEPGRGLMGFIAGLFSGTPNYEYPPPPSTRDVAGRVFDTFSKQLPEPPKN